MRTYNLTFSLYGEKDIIFQSLYAHIEERGDGLFCSLEGEYLRNSQSFEPPMRYKMSDVGVTTRDINTILREKYHFLLLRDYSHLAKELFQKR